MKLFSNKKLYILASSIAIAAILVYLPTIQNGLVNWDDESYISNNPYIRSLDVHFIKWAFSSFHAGFWIPLTWTSFAIDYAFWGLNPAGYHLTNVILHGLNTFLVVVLVARLMEIAQQSRTAPRNDNSPQVGTWNTSVITAAVTGLLFGLHPIHVESVAWATERKDVLYAFFFLLSILAYIRYVSTSSIPSENPPSPPFVKGRIRWYLFSLGLFLLALMSKPMAVTLPVVLLIFDWYPFRRFEDTGKQKLVFIEKIPFFVMSLAIAIIAITAHHFADALLSFNSAPLVTRILVAFKSLLSYLGMMLWPVNLVPFYSYPIEVSALSFEYLSSVLLVVGITLACIAISSKQRLWLAVWAYYTVTLLPVLGLFQAGQQEMADRFTYLPGIGPFFMMGLGVAWIFERVSESKRRYLYLLTIALAMSVVVICMSYATIKQIGVWKDSINLWNYVIEKSPQKIPFAYRSRGVAYGQLGQYGKAMEDFNLTIAVSPKYATVYNDRGVTYDKIGQYDRAIEDFSRAITLNPGDGLAYANRGLVFYKFALYEEALKDYTEAIRLTPNSSELYRKRGEIYRFLGRLEEAERDLLEGERIRF